MKCFLTSHTFHRCPSTTASYNSGRVWGVLQSRCYSPKQHFIRGFNLPPLTLKPNNQFPDKGNYVSRVFKRGNADLTHDKELVNVRLNEFSKRLDDIGTKRLDDFATRIYTNERFTLGLFGTIVGLLGLTIIVLGDQIDKLDKKIDKVSQDLDKKIEKVDDKLDKLSQDLDKKIEKVDDKLDKLSHDLLKEIHALGNKKAVSWWPW
jgi:chaperonin cofactor prefoldin